MVELKDFGYPFPRFQGRHCIIGGNWIGERAKGDDNPTETMCREFGEEFSFDRPIVTFEELSRLGFGENASYVVPGTTIQPDPQDLEDLASIKELISNWAWPWQDILQIVPTEIHNGKRPGSITLCSYHCMLLCGDEWGRLTRLQTKFGNLSNESITLITTVDQMIATDLMGTWGHDQALRMFLMENRVPRAEELPTLEGITIEPVGQMLDDYDEYMARYEIECHP